MAKRGSEDTTVAVEQHPKKMRKPDEVSVKFLLPNVVVGGLLTRKAAGLRRIREVVCHNKEFTLQISGKDQFYPGHKNERMVAIQGQPHQVHRACCMLQDQIIDDAFLVKDEAGENELGPRQGQMKIAVSDKAASKIIGTKGAVVKDLSQHFNIAITITPNKDVIVPDERIVTIVGPSQNIFDALDPIIYQISQQQVHVSCEFNYEQYNTKADEEKCEESEVDKDSEKVDQAEAVEADTNVESSEDKVEVTESNDADTEETKTDEKVSETDEKVSDEKVSETKQNSDKTKKLAKTARKDGKWTWQSSRNSRPKWVWVENQKTPINHSQRGARGGFYGGRGGGFGGYGGRGGRMWY